MATVSSASARSRRLARCGHPTRCRRAARQGTHEPYLSVFDPTPVAADIAATGADLITGEPCVGSLFVPAGSVAVSREIAVDEADG